MSLIIGSKISSSFILNHKLILKSNTKTSIIKNSFKFLNSPYLWGGRTPYGIDCSGFSQQVYKLGGLQLSRDANQQALEGKEIKLKNAKPGDLAFFGKEVRECLQGKGKPKDKSVNASVRPLLRSLIVRELDRIKNGN